MFCDHCHTHGPTVVCIIDTSTYGMYTIYSMCIYITKIIQYMLKLQHWQFYLIRDLQRLPKHRVLRSAEPRMKKSTIDGSQFHTISHITWFFYSLRWAILFSHPNNRNLPTKSQESSCLQNYRSRCTSNRQHRWSFLPVADYPHRRLEHQYREVPVLPTLRCAHFVERPVMRRLLNVNYPVVHSWFVKAKT